MSAPSSPIEQEDQYRREKGNIMSTSFGYSVGVGGLPGKIDPHINLGPIKHAAAPLFRKETYTNPLKRLSLSGGSKSKSNSKSRSNSTASQQDLLPHDNIPTDAAQKANPSPASHDPHPTSNTEQTSGLTPSDDSSEISYHSLDSTSPASQVSAILSLSNTIFADSTSSNPESSKYSSLPLWQKRLSSPNSIIIFATIPSFTSDADVESIAFLFAHPRPASQLPKSITTKPTINPSDHTHADQDLGDLLHIWLTGVVPQHQSKGIFRELMRQTETFATQRGFSRLSVATVPGVFGRMYEALRKSGWEVVRRVEEGEGQEKVYLIKNIAENIAAAAARDENENEVKVVTLREEEIGVAK